MAFVVGGSAENGHEHPEAAPAAGGGCGRPPQERTDCSGPVLCRMLGKRFVGTFWSGDMLGKINEIVGAALKVIRGWCSSSTERSCFPGTSPQINPGRVRIIYGDLTVLVTWDRERRLSFARSAPKWAQICCRFCGIVFLCHEGFRESD